MINCRNYRFFPFATSNKIDNTRTRLSIKVRSNFTERVAPSSDTSFDESSTDSAMLQSCARNARKINRCIPREIQVFREVSASYPKAYVNRCWLQLAKLTRLGFITCTFATLFSTFRNFEDKKKDIKFQRYRTI